MRSMPILCSLALTLGGCGGDDENPHPPAGPFPYDDGSTVVIGPDGPTDEGATPAGDDCFDVDGVCVQPQEYCGDRGTADVIVDDQGKVLDVICYPTDAGNTDVFFVDESAPDDRVLVDDSASADVGNNDVLVLDGAPDGDDIEGTLDVDANNVVVYGDGPDVSVVGGDVNVTKNNLVVRGVRVRGNVEVEFNDAKFVLCVIEGNVTITGNNTTIAACDIFGDVQIEGNNTVLVDCRIAGEVQIVGSNTECAGNISFTDSDDDFVVSESELGAPIECTSG